MQCKQPTFLQAAIAAIGATALLFAAATKAQDYPSRPIRVIVPFSPGGAVDGPMRIVAQELGYKGFDGVQWYGIVGPAKMPADVTRRLNAEINKAITSPALQQRLASEALTVMPMSPEQFGKFMQDEIAKYTALAKARNIRLDD